MTPPDPVREMLDKFGSATGVSAKVWLDLRRDLEPAIHNYIHQQRSEARIEELERVQAQANHVIDRLTMAERISGGERKTLIGLAGFIQDRLKQLKEEE